jgi:hypothetical protein
VWIGFTLTPREPLLYLHHKNPSSCGPHRPLGPPAGPPWLKPRTLVGHAVFGSGSDFLQGNRPTTVTVLYFLFSLQFKFSFNLNLNLVSIRANLCNAVEIFCNIVMTNFIFRL